MQVQPEGESIPGPASPCLPTTPEESPKPEQHPKESGSMGAACANAPKPPAPVYRPRTQSRQRRRQCDLVVRGSMGMKSTTQRISLLRRWSSAMDRCLASVFPSRRLVATGLDCQRHGTEAHPVSLTCRRGATSPDGSAYEECNTVEHRESIPPPEVEACNVNRSKRIVWEPPAAAVNRTSSSGPAGDPPAPAAGCIPGSPSRPDPPWTRSTHGPRSARP